MNSDNKRNPLNGLTILLVEPEPEIRAFYSRQLTNMDMRVVACDSIHTMHFEARQANPDVVILNPATDIRIALNSVRLLKREFPNMPVISMTLTSIEDHLDAMMNSGVSFHINRSLTRPKDLILALEQVISAK